MPHTDTTTINVPAMKARAVYLLVEADKADRAGAHSAPVVTMAHKATQALHDAGIPTEDVHRERDEKFIQYIRDSWNPGYQPTLDETGDGAPAAA